VLNNDDGRDKDRLLVLRFFSQNRIPIILNLYKGFTSLKRSTTVSTTSMAFSLVALTLLATPRPAAAEDIAVLIGVGELSRIRDANIPSPKNDVELMKGYFKSSGFSVRTLTGKSATKSAIRKVIKDAAQRVKAGDQMVVYYSGYCTEYSELLAANSGPTGDDTINRTEFFQWMDTNATSDKSLVIDATGSGSWTQGVSFPVLASGDELSTIRLVGHKQYSDFTYALSNTLRRRVDRDWVCDSWEHLLREVTRQLQTSSQPSFSSAFLQQRIFRGGTSVNEPVREYPRDWFRPAIEGNLLHFSNPDTNVLRLRVQADTPPTESGAYRPDTRMRIEFTANQPGYLFVLNVDDQGFIQLVGWDRDELSTAYPETLVRQSQLDRDLIGRPTVVGRGTLEITTTARNGTETWKAMLFANKEDALEFARLWASLAKGMSGHVRSIDWRVLPVGLRVRPITAEITYRVTSARLLPSSLEDRKQPIGLGN
jgi:hypothetical protein